MTGPGSHTGNRAPSGPTYWRSLEELNDAPDFRQWLESEFPHLPPAYRDGPSRRQFLKVAGAMFAMAGLAGCRWPKEKIVPATRQPVDRLPGETVDYASAFDLAGAGMGVLVTSFEGRPIKIEGNPQHPSSLGATNHWMQASVLDLYDPDRSRAPMQRSDLPGRGSVMAVNWTDARAQLVAHFAPLRDGGGQALAVLAEPSSSPTLADMRARLQQICPNARWFTWSPINRDAERAGMRQAFGQAVRPHLHLDKAQVIVSLDDDLLMMHPAALRHARQFATARDADQGHMNRLYVLESNLTVTGTQADHRYAVRSSDIGVIAAALAAAVEHAHDGHVPASAADAGVNSQLPLPWESVRGMAADLVAHGPDALVTVGPRQPAWVHACACRINETLGGIGRTVTYTQEPAGDEPDALTSLQNLAQAIDAGEIDTLLILGGNPVYDAPADVDFAGRLAKVATTLHLALYDNETSQRCTWHLPAAHWLESWSDTRAWDGTVSITQPLIAPLYDGLTASELLAMVTGDNVQKAHDLVRRTFAENFAAAAGAEAAWQPALHDGVVPGTAWPAQNVTCRDRTTPGDKRAAGTEVVFVPDYSVLDGGFANNAWLQEWPDPITKLTWDNAALISPTMAGAYGIRRNGDLLRIAAGQRELVLPACILPGHAENSVTVALGYGRGAAAGTVGARVGFNAYALRTTDHPHVIADTGVSAAGGHYELVGTQDHHAISSRVGDAEIQQRLPMLVREATLDHYKHHPDFAQHVVHHPPLQSLWDEKDYDKHHKWGMAIDLNKCIGCSACVLACQVENNVPVVGKDEVAVGREMHWLRIDRYFRQRRSDETPERRRDADVEVVHQPVACVQCEMAPCEQVCPVAATVHDEEGLNVMVYNRCIGTRYCSNNCPYKVRRFNWFYNHHGPAHPRSQQSGTAAVPGLLAQQELTAIEKLGSNPNVTMRSRGVMEKCTYCVQRINKVKIDARNAGRPIRDGEIVPACAQACPTGAIVFGNLNDPNSRVRKLHEHNRAYTMLAELNIKARTVYLAKLRNPRENGYGHEA